MGNPVVLTLSVWPSSRDGGEWHQAIKPVVREHGASSDRKDETERFTGTADFNPGVDKHMLTAGEKGSDFVCDRESGGEFHRAVRSPK